jgi:hypothetical protein
MACTMAVTRRGQQRSLLRTFQVLSVAMARSRGQLEDTHQLPAQVDQGQRRLPGDEAPDGARWRSGRRRSGGAAPVGLDQGAVDGDVGVAAIVAASSTGCRFGAWAASTVMASCR